MKKKKSRVGGVRGIEEWRGRRVGFKE